MRLKIFLSLFLASAILINAKQPENFFAQKAEEAIANGRYEDALDYARQEILDHEKNPHGYYQAALSLYALNQPGQALNMIDKAIQYGKKDKSISPSLYLSKYQLYQEFGDSINAIKALNDGLKINPNDISLLLNHATEIFVSNPKSAFKDLDKAKSIDKGNPRPYETAAYIYLLRSEYEQALHEINTAIQLDNSIANDYSIRALINKNLNNSPEWIKDCLKSYDLSGEESSAISILFDTSDQKEREQIIEEIENRKTSLNGLYDLEAFLLYNWQEFAGAGKVYQDIIDLGKGKSIDYYCLADCQRRLGFIFDAYNTASNGLSIFKDDVALQYLKAQVGIDVGKCEDAIAILNKLIRDEPELADLYMEKGKAYLNLGKYNDAVEPLATAVLLSPTIKNKLYYGDALRLSGQRIKAANEYNDLLHLSEEEIIENGFIAQYVYAMAFSGLSDYSSTLKCIEELSKINPEFKTQFTPSLFSRLGKKEDAINALRDYAKDNVWNARFDLYSYNFHNLHSEQAFVNLLAENGVTTKYNPTTKLLEFDPDSERFSMGGTAYADVMEMLSSNPKDWVKEMNKLCPIDMGQLGQITSVEFNEHNNTLIYNYKTSPLNSLYYEIKDNPSLVKEQEDNMILNLLNQNPALANLNLNIIYNFKSYDDKETCQMNLRANRIKELSKKALNSDEIDMMSIKTAIENDNNTFRKNGAIEGSKAFLDNEWYTILIIVPENDGTFSRYEIFANDIKSQMSKNFKDPSMMVLIPILLRQNIGFKYIFKSDKSNRTVEITFTPEEIFSYFNN